jgi:RNA polymerase sigma-70 factor, ECF subfamily
MEAMRTHNIGSRAPSSPPTPTNSAATARGELRAWFGQTVLGLLPDLTATARRFTRHQADAEDLIAETVTRAWKHLPELKDRTRFRGWVFRILTNTWISDCRARRSRPVHEPLPTDDDCFSLFERLHQPFLLWWGNPEREFLNNLLREDLERAVDELPEDFRAAVVLADVHGFAYKEIAGMLGVPIGTVRSRLARGRSRLQGALWEHARERGWVDETEIPQDRRGT